MNQNLKKINLLDCTLRDGGYAINFQFTSRDVRNITTGLEKAGIQYIEIGHGLGLGASTPKLGIAFESDKDYILATKESVADAKIGAFFIPGIGNDEDIKQGKKEGLDFLRIGMNVTEIDATIDSLKLALDEGLEVHLNLMKTYAISPEKLLDEIQQVADLDIKSVYVVDSAGSMFPAQVAEYVKALLQTGNWEVGFHGHNNLDLANANCLAAVDAGATFVDSSLYGMGRSAGNAQTEVMSFLLNKAGYPLDIDIFILFETAERYLKPIMTRKQGFEPLDVVIGMSQFHSGFLPRFKRVIDKYDVNLYKLIQKVSDIDCIDPSEELISNIAKDMSRTDI